MAVPNITIFLHRHLQLMVGRGPSEVLSGAVLPFAAQWRDSSAGCEYRKKEKSKRWLNVGHVANSYPKNHICPGSKCAFCKRGSTRVQAAPTAVERAPNHTSTIMGACCPVWYRLVGEQLPSQVTDQTRLRSGGTRNALLAEAQRRCTPVSNFLYSPHQRA